jgi:hypothetical protein
MSTTARKARKRTRHSDLSLFDALTARGLPTDTVFIHPPFQHPMKVGTPVAKRASTVNRRDAELTKTLQVGLVARVLARLAGRATR